MRPGADQVHVPLQDVEELRKLVQPEAPQPAADAGEPAAVVPCPLRRRPARGAHGAELDQTEEPPATAHALLDEEHRARRVELDREGDEREERREQDQAERGQGQAEGAGEGHIEARGAVALAEDQAARRELLDGDLARELLVELDAVLDEDAAQPQPEQRLQRHPAAARVQGDDHAVGAGALDHVLQAREVLEPAPTGRRLDGLVDEADHALPEMRPRLDLLLELVRQPGVPHDQDPLQERPALQQPVGARAQHEHERQRRDHRGDERRVGHARPAEQDLTRPRGHEHDAEGAQRALRGLSEAPHGPQVVEARVVEGGQAADGDGQGLAGQDVEGRAARGRPQQRAAHGGEDRRHLQRREHHRHGAGLRRVRPCHSRDHQPVPLSDADRPRW